ncbi:hypothetical protein [Mucilaginibacter gossypiicola]|nr:hypothetical protein [Mucilaginibacter gossypiicola]
MNKTMLLCACALIFFGCGSKNNNPTPSKPDYKTLIIGKWGNAKDTIREYTNDKLTKTHITNTQGDSYDFKADGTGIEKWTTLTIPYTYILSDKTLSFHTFSVKDGAATYPGNDFSFEIKSLTTNELILFYQNVDVDSKGNVYKEVEIDHYFKLSN